MHANAMTFAAVVGAALVVAAIASMPVTARRADWTTAATNWTVVMCADNGTFSGMSELAPFQKAVQNLTFVNIPNCPSVAYGNYPQSGNGSLVIPVILVTTGIGSVTTALCTLAFFNAVPPSVVTRVLWAGTAGQSSFAGGFDPSVPNGAGCGVPTQRPIPIGSVCVTAAAVNQVCGKCISNATVVPNECSEPQCSLHTLVSLVGECVFSGDRTLAKAVFAAGTQAPLPRPPRALRVGTAKFWAAFNGTGLKPPASTGVVFGPDECAEADQQNIDVGAPGDAQCRHYIAELLNSGGTGAPPVTMANTPCFVAMEGVGLLQAVFQMGSVAPPFAIIRGGANYHYYPLIQLSQGRWAQYPEYMPAAEYQALITLGYHYSILTTNTILMRYMNTVSH